MLCKVGEQWFHSPLCPSMHICSVLFSESMAGEELRLAGMTDLPPPPGDTPLPVIINTGELSNRQVYHIPVSINIEN